jgi:hypothetical protein
MKTCLRVIGHILTTISVLSFAGTLLYTLGAFLHLIIDMGFALLILIVIDAVLFALGLLALKYGGHEW